MTEYRIADAAAYLGKSVSTLKRWEKTGKLPVPRRVGAHRCYSEEDLHRLLAIFNPPSPAPPPIPTTPAKPWTETEPEAETATPWAEAGGEADERQKNLDALPDKCSDCWRSLTRHGITDPFGRRWLSASCEQHGVQARVAWP